MTTNASKPVLEALTREQEALCEAVAQEYLDDLTTAPEPDETIINRWLDVAYGLFDQDRPPHVEIVPSPLDACRLASEMTGEKITTTDDCGIGDGGWVSFYDYFHRIGVIDDAEFADVQALRDFARVAWDTILLDDCAIVIRRPVTLKLDDAGNLHCGDGPAIAWADGTEEYCWHGTWVDKRIVLSPRSYTREEYLGITNTEERRALSESGGWSWVAELLGSSVVDAWTDPATGLAYELLQAGEQKLLAKQSPPLKDGSQPRYLEPVHRDLRTAAGARKWQAVRWTPQQCDADPTLRYQVEA
jgi:hypothetical protein